MSFINNLFGTIAGQPVGLNNLISFIPNGTQGETINIKPEWMGLKDREMQLKAYESCYPLASIIDKLATLDINGEVEILKLKGKGKEDYAKGEWADRMNKLFQQPNPFQSWKQFRLQQVIYKKIFGFCPVLAVKPIGLSYAVTMVNIQPWLFQVKTNRNYLYATTKEDLIEGYYTKIFGEVKRFEVTDIMILSDTGFQSPDDDYALPMSRLVGLDMAISNICAAMEADNVLLKKRGPLGFISHDAAGTKDAVAGYIPMTEREKNELQGELTRYGLSLQQWQYVISRTAAKWNPMSFDVNQLGTKETVIACIEAICQRFGLPYILIKETDSTYSNGNEASKNVYINEVIPSANKDYEMYSKYFMAEENNAVITCCYDDIPALQEDELEKAQAAKAWNDALLIEWDNNLITKNQWLTQRGYDTVPDGDKYKQDYDVQRETISVQEEDPGTETTEEPET